MNRWLSRWGLVAATLALLGFSMVADVGARNWDMLIARITCIFWAANYIHERRWHDRTRRRCEFTEDVLEKMYADQMQQDNIIVRTAMTMYGAKN